MPSHQGRPRTTSPAPEAMAQLSPPLSGGDGHDDDTPATPQRAVGDGAVPSRLASGAASGTISTSSSSPVLDTIPLVQLLYTIAREREDKRVVSKWMTKLLC